MTVATRKTDAASVWETRRQQATRWFRSLRDDICQSLEALEHVTPTAAPERAPGMVQRTPWSRAATAEHPTEGKGEMSLIRGRVFEKGGVNISTVQGEFSEKFRKEIPGAAEDPRFWASGISLVIHPLSPKVPAVHMNTRMIIVGDPENPSKSWFGGGADLTPMRPIEADTRDFHAALQAACDAHHPDYYSRFKQWCDEYFFLPHRNEPRGVGGIFYDYLEEDWEKNFAFTQGVGRAFRDIYPKLVKRHLAESWSEEDRAHQLMRRGRYVEFNLLYDRGTRFGLMTGGNTEAILMSMPPEVTWR